MVPSVSLSSFFDRASRAIKAKGLSFFSQYEFSSGELDPQNYTVFEKGVLDLVTVTAEEETELMVFCPGTARKFISLRSGDGKKVPWSLPFEFEGTLHITVRHRLKGNSETYIPIMYLFRTRDAFFVKLIPVLAPREAYGWDVPLYHYNHALSKRYVLPFLWDVFPKNKGHVFDIPLPFPREYVLSGEYFIQEGIFYWIPFARRKWSKTMLSYNFTGEPVRLNLFYKEGVEEVEIPPDSKVFLEDRPAPEIVVAVGPNRLEWFPVRASPLR